MQREFILQALDRAANGAGSGVVAAACVRALDALFSELEPLVGVTGTRALYLRCLYLTRESVGWPVTPDGATREALLTSLGEHIEARDDSAARRASETLLTAFADLLISLIGEPLTLRLLQSAWGDPDAAGTPFLESTK
ncbi:MAG: hypothetical protein ABIO45_00230 [Burkholderiaceae bacterium]